MLCHWQTHRHWGLSFSPFFWFNYPCNYLLGASWRILPNLASQALATKRATAAMIKSSRQGKRQGFVLKINNMTK